VKSGFKNDSDRSYKGPGVVDWRRSAGAVCHRDPRLPVPDRYPGGHPVEASLRPNRPTVSCGSKQLGPQCGSQRIFSRLPRAPAAGPAPVFPLRRVGGHLMTYPLEIEPPMKCPTGSYAPLYSPLSSLSYSSVKSHTGKVAPLLGNSFHPQTSNFSP